MQVILFPSIAYHLSNPGFNLSGEDLFPWTSSRDNSCSELYALHFENFRICRYPLYAVLTHSPSSQTPLIISYRSGQ